MGRRSGLGSQRNGPTFGAPAPHSRRPSHAGGVRRGNGLGGINDNEEVNTLFGPPGHSGRPGHRGEDARAPFDVHKSARGPPHNNFEEEDSAGDRFDPRAPPQGRGGPQDRFGTHENHRGGHNRVPLGAQSNGSRGGRPDILREQHRFGDQSARVNQDDEIDDLPLPGLAERQPFEAAGAHPGRHHPFGQRRDPAPQGRESLRHERPGGSQRGVGNRARSVSVNAHEESDAGPSRALLEHRGAKRDKDPKVKGRRFVPYTFRTMPPDHAEFLARVFRVRMSKIKEWCEAELIRMDKKLVETNVDPLLSRLPSEDRERYEKKIRTMKNEQEIEKRLGLAPRHAATAYELGFYAGQSSVLNERRSGGYGGGRHR